MELLKFKKFRVPPGSLRLVSWIELFQVLSKSLLAVLPYYRELRKSRYCRGKTENNLSQEMECGK